MKPLIALAALALAPAMITAAQPAAAPPSGPAPSFQAPGPSDALKAEGALTMTLTAFAAGTPNLVDMDDSVVEAVKAQSGPLTATLTQLGPLKTLEYKGFTPNGVWHYHGEFANGQAELSIAFSNAGKITGLWCTPVKG
jgi:hypothetical protein